VAGPSYFDTGQLSHFITYLFLIYLPMFITFICCSVIPENPASRCFLMATILRRTPWPPQGPKGPIFQRCRKVKMKVRNRHCQATMKKLRAHLFALTIASLKAGCHVELSLQNLCHPQHTRFTALQGTHGNPWSNQVRFNSDSFPIGVDNHALYCYVNSPHLLDDLVLSNKGSVDGITDGIPIKGKGTFKFTIGDNNGRQHNIRILESLYIPVMKKCILSPQHWAQTVADKKTWMGNFDDCCILLWNGGQKTVPFSTTTNVPIFFTAPSLRTYQTFAATFEACKAPFFQRETVLHPGCMLLRENAKITPEEFVAEEDFHCGNKIQLVDDKVIKDKKTICKSNVPDSPDVMATPDESICRGPLIFNLSPSIAADEDVTLAAADDQAELMQRHYRLGHLSFQMLKQLTLNDEIPKKLSKLKPPPSALAVYLV
jgi:hypothetical protein